MFATFILLEHFCLCYEATEIIVAFKKQANKQTSKNTQANLPSKQQQQKAEAKTKQTNQQKQNKRGL